MLLLEISQDEGVKMFFTSHHLYQQTIVLLV